VEPQYLSEFASLSVAGNGRNPLHKCVAGLALTIRSTDGTRLGMDIGEYIKERRQSQGLTLRKAATLVGFDAAYLSRIEAGKVAPSDEIVGRLAKVLSCEKEELFVMAGRLPDTLRPTVDEQTHSVVEAIRDTLNAALDHAVHAVVPKHPSRGQPLAIDDGFPFEAVSDIAEAESWRKEVYRPIYHVHKWWAQRLGSIFRAAIIASAVPQGSPVLDYFRQAVSLDGLVVFDPFMGSGTTVGEAHKLGCTAIGRDINPVAYRAVRAALGPADRKGVEQRWRPRIAYPGSTAADDGFPATTCGSFC